ncbi:hypothetical protein FRC04_009476 [Tulasnella sp. 424]|nr:hypothetical protein FRC04_009476 [Tulasnella sp. 424]
MASDRLRNRVQQLMRDCITDFQSESKQSGNILVHEADIEISRLDEELACLQNIKKTIIAEISARVIYASTLRNSLLLIHRLPPEILSYILEESLGHFDATPEPRTTRRLRALALVCRQWRYALDQSPSVWGWIDFTQDASFAVQKSREASLSINFVNEGNFGSTELQHGLATLLPHSKRWVSLQICMTPVAAAHFVPVFGSLSLPNLEDLGLLLHARDWYDPPNVDCLERYPLRRLVLRGISTSWDTIAGFAGLRSLTIADLSYRSAWPSRAQIGSILLGCYRLEELTLSNLENHPADVEVHDPVPLAKFYVPALRSVALNDILNTREAALWVLESITAPNLIGLSVTGTWTNRKVGRPIASVLTRQRTDSPFPVVMANLGSRPVHVRITQRECRIECGHLVRRGAHRGVEVSLPSTTYADAWQRVIDLVSCVLGDLPLDLEIDKLPQHYLANPDPDPDPAILGQLPSLSVLRMLQVPNVEAFLLFLCSESSSNHCCPNLTDVHMLASSLTRTEMWRHAVNALMEKRPDLALYDGVRRISPDL